MRIGPGNYPPEAVIQQVVGQPRSASLRQGRRETYTSDVGRHACWAAGFNENASVHRSRKHGNDETLNYGVSTQLPIIGIAVALVNRHVGPVGPIGCRRRK
jgi:hypothetical protein